jgi:hypothetical protein
MLSIIGGQAEIIDMRKKSCIYVSLRKFKDTVSNSSRPEPVSAISEGNKNPRLQENQLLTIFAS